MCFLFDWHGISTKGAIVKKSKTKQTDKKVKAPGNIQYYVFLGLFIYLFIYLFTYSNQG